MDKFESLNQKKLFFPQEFGEAGTMLSATCDEFLKNLCDCVELAEGNFGEYSKLPSTATYNPWTIILYHFVRPRGLYPRGLITRIEKCFHQNEV